MFGGILLPVSLSFDLGNKEKKYRHKLEIIRDMLSVALKKTRKTKIMYQTNLSYSLMEKYLRDLLEAGLMECDGDSCYSVTEKGKEFLQMFTGYLERCERIREEVDVTARDRLLLESMCFNGKAVRANGN
jgi:predicted transcriptional regulator